MERYSANTFPSTQNLFENEEISKISLRNLILTPVGYNSCNDLDPMDPSLEEVKEGSIFPEWVNKYYKNYKCIDRLTILAQRNRYIKSGSIDKERFLYIEGGYIVDLKLNVQFHANFPDNQRQIVFKNDRKKNSKVKRPEGSNRYIASIFQFDQNYCGTSQPNIVQDLEITYDLGWTFYLENGKKYPSIKQVFDGLMQEMRFELISCQSLTETQQQLEEAISNHTQAWKFIFQSSGLDINSEEKIKRSDLENPFSELTKSILFMYSTETFLPYSLNKAERDKDISKLQSLGPFIWVLGRITNVAQFRRSRNDYLTPETCVFRGVKLPREIYEEYKQIKEKKKRLQIKGFTSTSMKREIAFKFMFKGLKNNEVSVLYQINNLNSKGWYYFKLDNSEYSLFPKEQEVLLRTGSQFNIIEISEEQYQSQQYILVKLEYYN